VEPSSRSALWPTTSVLNGPGQPHLLPVSPRDWLPEGHLALFIADALGQMDLRAILSTYAGGRGPQGYHPRMLLAVLFHGYCTAVYSSRRLAKHCETDIAFRLLSAGQLPDFRTLADFRRRHVPAFHSLFLEVLRLCREAGLVQLGASLPAPRRGGRGAPGRSPG
jgi:transposase